MNRPAASGGGGGVTPYNGFYGEAPDLAERGTFFRLWVFKRVGIFQVEVYERVGLSAIQKGPLLKYFKETQLRLYK